jgi:TPR repeat protein
MSGCSSEHVESIAARSGFDPAAEHNLGRDYYYGRNGKPRDRKEAYEFFKRAAEKGLPEAQHALGLMFLNGDSEAGVPRDPGQSARLFESAAEKGLAAAAESLAEMHERGIGVRRDSEQAERWMDRAEFLRYEKGAKDGDITSMFRLGCRYRDGVGVEKDKEKALQWFKKAAEQGHKDSVVAMQNMRIGGTSAGMDLEEEWAKEKVRYRDILKKGGPESEKLREKFRKLGIKDDDVLWTVLNE